MFIEQTEMIDKVVRDIDVRDLVDYLQVNHNNYIDRLLDYLQQEELVEHTQQSKADIVNGQLVFEQKDTEILLWSFNYL